MRLTESSDSVATSLRGVKRSWQIFNRLLVSVGGEVLIRSRPICPRTSQFTNYEIPVPLVSSPRGRQRFRSRTDFCLFHQQLRYQEWRARRGREEACPDCFA